MDQLTDTVLIEKLRKGDDKAFRQLFHKYFQPLFLFCCKFVDEDVTKDIVQDCFLELWMRRQKIEITKSFSSWIFMVVKNKCLKHLKDELRKDIRQNDYRLKLKEEELNFFIHSEKSILEFEFKDRIRKVMELLPPKCKIIFHESRLNGLSNKEISEKYNISIKAVEKQISKALKLFREEFQDLIIIFLITLFHSVF